MSSSGFLLQHLEELIELFDLVITRYAEGHYVFGPVSCAAAAGVPGEGQGVEVL